MYANGYFARELPRACNEDPDSIEIHQNDVLAQQLGKPGLWPLQPATWDDDIFCDLIEVFHDLAARPRTRRYHSYYGCGWEYFDFATDIGRALYRWQVNELLCSGRSELAWLGTAKTSAGSSGSSTTPAPISSLRSRRAPIPMSGAGSDMPSPSSEAEERRRTTNDPRYSLSRAS